MSNSALSIRADHRDNDAMALVEPWLDATADDNTLLEQVAGWYARCLAGHTLPQQALARRSLNHPEQWAAFEIGFADRRLGRVLPSNKTAAGKELRVRLTQLGVLRDSGHARYSGSITFPLRDAGGTLVDIYGRKIGRNLARGSELHTYLPGGTPRGIFNHAACTASDTVVVADSPLNALALWCAGIRAVTCTLHGQDTLGDELVALLTHGTALRVVTAFRNTPAGVTHAEHVTARLKAAGLHVVRLTFGANRDANGVLMQAGPQRLVALVRDALSRDDSDTRLPEIAPLPIEDEETVTLRSNVYVADAALVNDAVDVDANGGEQDNADTDGNDGNGDKGGNGGNGDNGDNGKNLYNGLVAGGDDSSAAAELRFVYDDRHWRVRGLERNHSLERLKVNLRVTRDELFHVNLFDLYSASQRRGFIREASQEIHVPEDLIKRDLGHVLSGLETRHEELVRKTLEPQVTRPVEVTGQDRDAALALLHDPKLLGRILSDYERLGIVGEAVNKQLAYLACVSRLLERPLAVLLQSSSAAGKTSLMDASLALVPPEAVIRYSALTGQSLYYMGQQDLRHKILAVAEEEGIAEASYALKLLQSDGRLRIASAGKDEHTGRHRTQDYEVEGPVMMFLTTTAEQPDAELQNRCLTLRVNESAEQTAAIHAMQRARYTLAGQQRLADGERICRTHQNAQRLLRSYPVVIPWADRLTFRHDQTRLRRDHDKYLALIAASTLLHQFQRKKIAGDGEENGTERLVATLTDVDLAGRLMTAGATASTTSLMPGTRQLLIALDAYVAQQAKALRRPRLQVRFKQRELREALGVSDFTLRKHLARLVELEYVLAYRTGRGNEREYELVCEYRDGDEACNLGLMTAQELSTGNYDDRIEHPHERNEPPSSMIRAPCEPPQNGTQVEPPEDVTPNHRAVVPETQE